MNMNRLSVRIIIFILISGALLTAVLLIAIMYFITKNIMVIFSGFVLVIGLFGWGWGLIHILQNKLSGFTSDLCRSLDAMMDGNDRPEMNHEDESLLARISHRLERLYGIMQESRRKVQEEKEELQSLISDISHQTKTPISNLIMVNDTLLTRPMTEEQRHDFLQAMGSQLNKLDFLIQAMVKTSRLETGVITLEKKSAAIADTLVNAINGVLVLLEKKRINFTADCPQNLTVPHDIRWIAEALFNLLDNAVKYTPVGGSVRVSVQSLEMYIRIDVTDTGKGIPEKEQTAIFKRFYRTEDVHEVDGIGIGLYLAREIITMQGGYITVTSEISKGSTFSVFLPSK